MSWIQQFFIDHFKTSTDTSATIVISLTVFLLGFFVQWIARMIRKIVAEYRIRKMTKTSLKHLVSQFKKQSTTYQRLVSQIDLTKSQTLIRYNIAHIGTSSVLDIGYANLYAAFISGIRI
jgi:hypothetical protein